MIHGEYNHNFAAVPSEILKRNEFLMLPIVSADNQRKNAQFLDGPALQQSSDAVGVL